MRSLNQLQKTIRILRKSLKENNNKQQEEDLCLQLLFKKGRARKYCDICFKEFYSSSFANHLRSQSHLKWLKIKTNILNDNHGPLCGPIHSNTSDAEDFQFWSESLRFD